MTTKQARKGTGISWTDETWNPTVGCSRVSPGCVNCYAEHAAAMVNRTQGKRSVYLPVLKLVNGDPRWNGLVKLIPGRLDQPLRWTRARRIFVNSMSDLFHEELTNEQIAAVFGAMAAAPWHTFQILTKRARRMREWFAWVERAARECNDGRGMTPAAFCFCHAQKAFVEGTGADQGEYPLSSTNACHNGLHAAWPLPNVWLGVSVENQDCADDRIPELLETPAAIRFLSCEPLLEEVSLFAFLKGPMRDECLGKLGGSPATPGVDWVIVGCESGAGARPCEVAWLRSMRDECTRAGVAYFLKQATTSANAVTMIEHRTPLDDAYIGESPRTGQFIPTVAAAAGSKRKPGNVIELPYLDGVQHAAFPEPHVPA